MYISTYHIYGYRLCLLYIISWFYRYILKIFAWFRSKSIYFAVIYSPVVLKNWKLGFNPRNSQIDCQYFSSIFCSSYEIKWWMYYFILILNEPWLVLRCFVEYIYGFLCECIRYKPNKWFNIPLILFFTSIQKIRLNWCSFDNGWDHLKLVLIKKYVKRSSPSPQF